MVIKTNVELPNGYSLITGFPQCNDSWSIIGYSGGDYYKTIISSSSEYLETYVKTIPKNTIIHLKGSYEIIYTS